MRINTIMKKLTVSQVFWIHVYPKIYIYIYMLLKYFYNSIECHNFNKEQYIPYSLVCDLFSRNSEAYLHDL